MLNIIPIFIYRYKQNILLRSSLLREQPVSPLNLAVYWIEHVVKYKGAAHLQNAGVKLHWFQSYLLDVILLLTVLFFGVMYLNYILTKKCLKFVSSRFCTKSKEKVN